MRLPVRIICCLYNLLVLVKELSYIHIRIINIPISQEREQMINNYYFFNVYFFVLNLLYQQSAMRGKGTRRSNWPIQIQNLNNGEEYIKQGRTAM